VLYYKNGFALVIDLSYGMYLTLKKIKMKTLRLLSGVVLLMVLSISCSSSSDSNPAQTCDQAEAATDAAEQAFNASTPSNHEELCNAYKAALQNEIDVCGDPVGVLQSILTDLGDCTVAPDLGVISVNIGGGKTFETNITVSVTGTTKHVEAHDDMQNNDYVTFDLLQGTGAAVLTNFHIHLLSHDFIPMTVADGGNWTTNITANTATSITGTFYGYVTAIDNGADLDLPGGVISIHL
jgi:hypothetical protein